MSQKQDLATIGTVLLILLIALLFFSVAFNLRPVAIITNAWTQEVDTKYRYSIEYPAKWVEKSLSREDDDVIFHLQDAGAFKLLIRRQIIDNPTPEDVANWGKAMIGEQNQQTRMKGTPLGYEELEVWEESVNGNV